MAGVADNLITTQVYTWVSFPVTMYRIPNMTVISDQGTGEIFNASFEGAGMGRSDVVANRVNSGTYTAEAEL